MSINWYKTIKKGQLLPQIPNAQKGIVKGPKQCVPEYRVGMKIRDRRKGMTAAQKYGVIRKIADGIMEVEWFGSKDNKTNIQKYNLDDTVTLFSIISEI